MAKVAIKIPKVDNTQVTFFPARKAFVDYSVNPKYKREYIELLSFRDEPLRQGRHKIHPYPAMLHPMLVDYLIENFVKERSVILDPFSGSGVSLYQASIKNIKSYGFDINPIALLISIAKTDKYNINELEKEIGQLKNDIKNSKQTDIPTIKNINYWYSKSVQNSLGKIRFALKNNEYKYQNLYKVCFALICRDQSFTRNGEFKRYRIKADRLDTRMDEVFKRYFDSLRNVIEYIEKSDKPKAEVTHILDTSENVEKYNIDYDAIITSPPYGDSRTTVAYGEFSSFALEWINDLLGDMAINYKIDSQSVGKKRPFNNEVLKSKMLQNTLEQIREKDTNRAGEVADFFNEYYIILKNTLRELQNRGTACYIVGNRRVKGIEIPMDQITAEMMEMCGLRVDKILVRDISSKVMPSSNSPTNKTGIKDKTMSYEYIIIANKE